eukprot:525037-Prymnesium_polylepis.1
MVCKASRHVSQLQESLKTPRSIDVEVAPTFPPHILPHFETSENGDHGRSREIKVDHTRSTRGQSG